MIVFLARDGLQILCQFFKQKKLKKDFGGTVFVLPPVLYCTHDD